MLLNPNLRTVSLRMHNVGQEPGNLRTLERIPMECPQLTTLVINCNSKAKVFTDTIETLASGLSSIVVFELLDSPISAAVLAVLANSANLRRLCIAPDKDSIPSEMASSLINKDRAFGKLRELVLHVGPLEHATQFIPYVTSSRLVGLVISYRTPATAEEIESVFKAVLSHPSRRKLRCLKVMTRDTGISMDPLMDLPTFTLTSKSLLPLLKLRLETLVLRGSPVDIDDDTLETMAISWPELTRLTLGVDMRLGDRLPPRATLLSLIPFIENCPNIMYIGYRMQTDVLREEGEPVHGYGRPGNGAMTEGELEMEVGDSRIHNSIEVASFLSDICPTLWYIGTLWRNAEDIDEDESDADVSDEEDMYNKWDKVTDYLPHFVKVRQQERDGELY
ncbi:hypothetical protein EVJ58_g5775 [Rhodofomes roseus]|nr:hypothetical protein EVJ58_g5775 [Rhodofomes roseus]